MLPKLLLLVWRASSSPKSSNPGLGQAFGGKRLRRIAIIAALVFTLITPAVARAQFAMCGNRVQIIDQLKAKYNETRQAVGLISNNGAAELYVSEKGTWTMLITLESGKSCIIAAGHSWDSAPTLAQGTGI